MTSEELCDLVIEALEDVKARDIVKLDVREMTTVTDYMIVNGCSSICRTRWFTSCCRGSASSTTWRNSGC